MNIDPLPLAGGLALLWFPRHWMRRLVALARHRRHSRGSEPISDAWKDREPGDPHVSPREEFKKARNYIDLARAGFGGLLIWGGLGVAPALVAVEGEPRSVANQVLGAQSVIVALAVLIQTVRYEKHRLSFFPPIFFLAGLSMGMCGYKAAVFAFILIWAINPGLKNAQAFLALYAVIIYIFGALFNSLGTVPVGVLTIMTFLPVLLSWMTNRPLLAFTRRRERSL